MSEDTLVLPTDLTFEEALEVTEAISQALGSMADVYEAALPFIHKSFAGRAWKTLGHHSPAEYVTKYFGNQLSRLGVDMRRDVVRELTAARISAREQAEILGVSHPTVLKDQKSTGRDLPVDSKVISRDGRERPATQLPPPPPVKSAEQQDAEILSGHIAQTINTALSVTHPERRQNWINAWKIGSIGASPPQRANVTPNNMRAIADGLHALANEWTES